MEKIIIIILIISTHSFCIAQAQQLGNIQKKDSIIEPNLIINDTLADSAIYLHPLVYVSDYNLTSSWNSSKVEFPSVGQIIIWENYEALSCNLNLSLHSESYSDIEGVSPPTIGNLKGQIIGGKKEGKWEKDMYFENRKYIIKTMNYKSGLLDGEYIVYNLKGDTLNWSYQTKYIEEFVPELDEHNMPVQEKFVTIFKNGTGNYTDYYYDTGILKLKGRMLKGKREGLWNYYDRKGELIHFESYVSGFIISD